MFTTFVQNEQYISFQNFGSCQIERLMQFTTLETVQVNPPGPVRGLFKADTCLLAPRIRVL